MQLTWEQFENVVRKKLRTNQFLLFISIVIGISVFIINRDSVLWSILFIGIGSLSLPNINKIKEDMKLFKENNFTTTSGKVLDVFPETDEGDNWIIFLEDTSKSKIVELVVPTNPNISVEQGIIVHFTPKMTIPVKIEVNLENA